MELLFLPLVLSGWRAARHPVTWLLWFSTVSILCPLLPLPTAAGFVPPSISITVRREALCIHSPPPPSPPVLPSSPPLCLFSCVFSCLLQLEAYSLVVHEERLFYEWPQRMPGTGGGSRCDWLSWPPTCSGIRASCPEALCLFRSLCNSLLLIYSYTRSFLSEESLRNFRPQLSALLYMDVSGFLRWFLWPWEQECKNPTECWLTVWPQISLTAVETVNYQLMDPAFTDGSSIHSQVLRYSAVCDSDSPWLSHWVFYRLGSRVGEIKTGSSDVDWQSLTRASPSEDQTAARRVWLMVTDGDFWPRPCLPIVRQLSQDSLMDSGATPFIPLSYQWDQ